MPTSIDKVLKEHKDYFIKFKKALEKDFKLEVKMCIRWAQSLR